MTGSISFDRLAEIYDATRGGLTRGRMMADDLTDFVLPGRVVEIGIGTGAVALALRERLGQDVLGVDISSNMAELARNRLGNVVAVGDAERLPVASASVDTMLAVWVLQLVPDPVGLLREAIRALRPGGRLLILAGPPVTRPDDIEPILAACLDDLRRPGASAGNLRQFAGEVGLHHATEGLSTELVWDEAPNHTADRIEQRTFGLLLDLDDDEFEQRAVPAVAALRSLPEPDRPRRRAARHPYLVFERP